MMLYDVVVVGGGTAGVIAAVQAGREHARTLLIEKSEILGGTIVNGRVAFPGLFHAWKKQIIGGIGWELVCKSMDEENRPYPDVSTQVRSPHNIHQIAINGPYYALICDEAVAEAGVEVLFDTMCAKVVELEDRKVITVCTKTGLQEIETKVLIDCTGDANVASLAGYELLREDEFQPATYSCKLEGYDVDSLDLERIGENFDREVQAGNLSYTDVSWTIDRFNPQWLRAKGANGNHVDVEGCRGRTSEERSAISLKARLTILKLLRFFRKQSGLEHIRLDALAAECGIRETVRIKGKKMVTQEQYLSGERYGDDLCYSFYPIDLHTKVKNGLSQIYLEEGVVPTIPRGALLPEHSRNFLVAGRCISSDRAANSALRVQATCMAVGQAAGAIAALAAKQNVDVEEVPMEDIYEVLRRHHAIVPSEQ